jgi:shikimate kinase
MDPQTRALILDTCIAIWLDADPAVLAERVSRRDSRPLLKDKDPLAVLQSLAEIRNPFYAEAHIHVRSEPAPHDSAVEQIIAALARWQEDQPGRDETDPQAARR